MLFSPDVYILLLGPGLNLLASIKGLLINEGQEDVRYGWATFVINAFTERHSPVTSVLINQEPLYCKLQKEWTLSG